MIAEFWGAHACSVLAIAFRDRELSAAHCSRDANEAERKIVSAKCRNQHATSVRSPTRLLALCERRKFSRERVSIWRRFVHVIRVIVIQISST